MIHLIPIHWDVKIELNIWKKAIYTNQRTLYLISRNVDPYKISKHQ